MSLQSGSTILTRYGSNRSGLQQCTRAWCIQLMDKSTQTGLQVYLLAALSRLLLIIYGHWQDTTSVVKYTDVDYYVFRDAAQLVVHGGSPYERPTYRYTPMIAWLLVPSVASWGHPAVGKLLFAGCDLGVGVLIEAILTTRYPAWGNNGAALAAASSWLLNPVVINISTRGSADSIVNLLVLLAVLMVLKGRPLLAGLVHGLAVHVKVYPVIFSLALWLHLPAPRLAPSDSNTSRSFRQTMVRYGATDQRLKLVAGTAMSIVLCTVLGLHLYGSQFLQHSLLYHLTRTDNRHNFAPWFYTLYLDYARSQRALVGFVAFVPQIALLFAVSVALGPKDLPLCIAVETLIFVTFNKVITAQYFSWYLSVFPAAAPSLLRLLHEGCCVVTALGCAWLAQLLLWLVSAYQLEFLGNNTFTRTWVASVGFFAVNVALVAKLVGGTARSGVKERTGSND